MVSERVLDLEVNGQRHRILAPVHHTLLEVLRYRLGFTGSKQGCDKGDCGACTVLIDGKAKLACLTLAVEVEGHEILTIEGLADPSGLHPVQEAFDRTGALQCGFCQPGMMLSASALLEKNEHPSRADIEQALGGNLCRCTGYTKIVSAIQDAAATMAQQGHEDPQERDDEPGSPLQDGATPHTRGAW